MLIDLILSGSLSPLDAPALEDEPGNVPGIPSPALGVDIAAGTGDPRRFPDPVNVCEAPGRCCAGTNSSFTRRATRSSTGWPGRTSRMDGGARLGKK